MNSTKFVGLIQDIIETPNIDVVELLQDNLLLPPDKAEILARRIEKERLQAICGDTEQKLLGLVAEKPVNSKQHKTVASYKLESLSNKEFEVFTKWFLQELGYNVSPKEIPAVLGVDYIVTKSGLKTVVLSRKYHEVYIVSDVAVLLAQQAKNIYQCEHAIFLVSTVFSEQAKLEAEKCGVELWDIQKIGEKIVEIKQKAEFTMQVSLPIYKESLLDSLLSLAECKVFIIEKRANEKYDLFFPGVMFPLLTFQVQKSLVTRLVFRVKYNESVGENAGETLISYDRDGNRFGPEDIDAYMQVVEYLEQFLE